MIQIRHLSFRFDRDPVLHDITIQLPAGTLCGLFGPNGSGKTTLFRCCMGLLPAGPRERLLMGKDVHGLSAAERARLAAYVPQEHGSPFPYLVKEIVLMGRTPHLGGSFFGIGKKHGRAVHEALDRVGIVHLANRRYDQLSGGQRQLVLIARALVQDTQILFLDEPTSALDFDNQVRIWRTLRDLADQGRTILACSHDPNYVAWFCDRVVVLNRGRIEADGPPEETITPEVLSRVYHESFEVRQIGGSRVVLPRDSAAKEGKKPAPRSISLAGGI